MPDGIPSLSQDLDFLPQLLASPDIDKDFLEPVACKKRGVFRQLFPEKAWLAHNMAIKLLGLYVRAFNLSLQADQEGALKEQEDRLRAEFGPVVLRDHTAIIQAAGEEYLDRRRRSSNQVKAMSMETEHVLPAVGDLRAFIDQLIQSGEVPEAAKGITPTDVTGACFIRAKGGIFLPLVKYRAKPKPRPKPVFSTWLIEHNRHPYSDAGFAVAPDGLHISLLAPKDGQEWVMNPSGRGPARLVSHLDFQVGKPPIRWRVPLEIFTEIDFGENLWSALNKLRFQFRTVVLDASFLPHLPFEVRRSVVQFHRWLRKKCTGSRILYLQSPTIGSESRACLKSMALGRPVDGAIAQSIMGQSGLECPRCRATLLIATSLHTGAPTETCTCCENCHADWDVGQLLADKARDLGAAAWAHEDGYSCE